jgi:ribosome-associated protein
MLIDFVDVVVHVFNQESRQFYDLDGLWGDAKPVEWRDEPAAAPR